MSRLILFCLLLTACSGPYQPIALYGLGADQPTGALAAPAHAVSVRLSTVAVAPPCSETAFVYRYSDGRLRQDAHAGFISQPAALLGTRLVQLISARGAFTTVAGPLDPLSADYDLAVSIDFLGTAFDGQGHGAALVEGRAWLLKGGVTAGEVSCQWFGTSSVPLAGDESGAVAAALSAAADQWGRELADALAQCSLKSP